MTEKPPSDPADHAEDFAVRWSDKLEEYCALRMEDLGVPADMIGQPNYDGDGRWHAFDPHGRQGGANTTGVVIDSGVLNPGLLKGRKGGKLWAEATLKDRIDATIPHEYEELRYGGDHVAALKAAAKSRMPITDMAKRINRARAR
jgi:hypothetical protein